MPLACHTYLIFSWLVQYFLARADWGDFEVLSSWTMYHFSSSVNRVRVLIGGDVGGVCGLLEM